MIIPSSDWMKITKEESGVAESPEESAVLKAIQSSTLKLKFRDISRILFLSTTTMSSGLGVSHLDSTTKYTPLINNKIWR